MIFVAMATNYRRNIEMSISSIIDKEIKKRVSEICKAGKPDLLADIVATDSIGEVLEKMIILHIRTWMLEDEIGLAESDEEVANLKRKIDVCFKKKRPKYIEAVNKMIDDAIVNGRILAEEDVKLYKMKEEKNE